LAQAVKEVGDIMNVSVVPFGNAKFGPNGGLKCQHGPDECVANSYEQCVIDLYPDFASYFPFYNCIESKIDSGLSIQQQAYDCAGTAGLDLAEIESCVSDKPRAAALQQKFNNMTPSAHKCAAVPDREVPGVHCAWRWFHIPTGLPPALHPPDLPHAPPGMSRGWWLPVCTRRPMAASSSPRSARRT
jgi:hypothetical protein